jgi:hypothetical protein
VALLTCQEQSYPSNLLLVIIAARNPASSRIRHYEFDDGCLYCGLEDSQIRDRICRIEGHYFHSQSSIASMESSLDVKGIGKYPTHKYSTILS